MPTKKPVVKVQPKMKPKKYDKAKIAKVEKALAKKWAKSIGWGSNTFLKTV